VKGRGHLVAAALWIALVALNLRPAVTGVGPVLPDIRASLHLSGVEASLLTTLPLLCFGLLGPTGPAFARKLGIELVLFLALAGITGGLVLRSAGGEAPLYAGTALAGSAIALGNVLLPPIVKRDFAGHPGLATGTYTMVLGGAAALSAGLTVPLGHALGLGWRGELAIWAVPAGLALIAWAPRLRGHTLPDASEAVGDLRSLLRDRIAWAVAIYFGVQSMLFYASISWLPTLYRDHGYTETEAGLIVSVLTLIGLPAGLIVPTLAARAHDQRLWAVATTALAAVGLAGFVFAPTAAPYVWAVVLGTGLGATFPLVLTLIVLRTQSQLDTGHLSALAQSVGYGLAALGPLAVGALHDATGSWEPAFGFLLALTVIQLWSCLRAARPGYVRSTSAGVARGA
jgi:CP family cyanate transporter-like MFS transporter